MSRRLRRPEPGPTILCWAALLVAAASTGCGLAPPPGAAPSSTHGAEGIVPPELQPTEPTVAGPPEPAPVDPVAELAHLVIDDNPDGAGYRRDLFMPGGDWQDTDGNGCDARRDALRAQAAPPVTAPGCSTEGGRWPLVYVPGVTSNPSDVDVDHVVPLADAWRSGARHWPTDRLVAYAADPAVLWVVDDGANQSKGDRGPDEWRPPSQTVWCTYARRWTSIKVTYGLTATTSERDALGHMLEEC
jgi:hypothetical protein